MYRASPCVTLFVSTSLAIAFVTLIITNLGSNTSLSLISLPSSSWTWSTPSTRSSKTALYQNFSNPKIQRVVESLIKELNAESLWRSGRKRDENMEKIERDLVRVRESIKEAINSNSSSLVEDEDYVPKGLIYRNAYVFQRSYLLMESMLKIYVYEEGEPPLFHSGPCKDIYSTEGLFLNMIESSSKFRTRDPDEAQLYFLPFSVVMILQHLFHPMVRDKAVLERVIGDYVRIISSKYPFWNRSLGADHFMLSCHDWGPRATWYVHQLYFTSIRALCNANSSEFFNPRKDVPFPEINFKTGNISISGISAPNNREPRSILAFFAGRMHGLIRPLLFKHWKDKDDNIRVYENVSSYQELMRRSKYCLCPSGFEVASPRIAEAIYAECVPVLISQDYILPFNDVLDWTKFSVQVSPTELPNLKTILMGINEERYKRIREGVKQVKRHFVINDPPKRYDVFHMLIHSLWLRRLNVRIYG